VSLLVFGALLPWLIVALGCRLGYQLVQQSGRILLRLEALEDRLTQLGSDRMPARGLEPAAMLPMAPTQAPVGPAGLPVGSPAPPFDLPDLQGNRVALEQFRGRWVLLVSWDPACGFCRQMAPELAALPFDGTDGRPVPLVIASDDAAQNRALVEEFGIRCPVLLQERHEVTSAYQATGTPMGCLIDDGGAIASPVAAGAQALLALYEQARVVPPGSVAERPNNGHRVSGTRPLEKSRLIRHGLSAGTPAPSFRLPQVGGSELSLDAFQGQRLLLVFSDPDCGPCQELAPKLEQLHRQATGLTVVMVSRGTMEANRAKSLEQGLTFPIVLQHSWEVSRAYGMFATPIGYLIDEDGIIIADVASGTDAILALASRAEAVTS
jgi:peroxiredoxin